MYGDKSNLSKTLLDTCNSCSCSTSNSQHHQHPPAAADAAAAGWFSYARHSVFFPLSISLCIWIGVFITFVSLLQGVGTYLKKKNLYVM